MTTAAAKASLTIGGSSTGAVAIDIDRLIESRLLVQATSGAGKSWALRRILEQTHGRIQHIVIDVEGEFYTLREKFDYVLAGKGGDCPADTRSASLLARRILELGVSAIIDIYELRHADRIHFVRLFLEALVNAPKELWHPALVVIDEAHMFAPESGSAESAQSVIDLQTRGRKRGFVGVLATQRPAALDKNASATCLNRLTGLCVQDIDVKRAAADLGFYKREDIAAIKSLAPGQFFAVGPAISKEVLLVNVGTVETTHPRAGHRAATPPPPREKVQAVLSKLADLPKQAEEEARTTADLSRRVRELESELRQAKGSTPAASPEQIAAAESRGYLRGLAEGRLESDHLAEAWEKAKGLLSSADSTMGQAFISVISQRNGHALHATASHSVAAPLEPRRPVPPRQEIQAPRRPAGGAGAAAGPGEKMAGAERKVLTVLAQYPHGRTKVQVAVLAGYAHTGGGFNNSLSSLRTKGWIEGGGDRLTITDAGLRALGDYQPLPTGVDLQRYWLAELGKAEREILSVLCDAYPQALSKEEAARRTPSQYQPSGGGFNNALSRLRTLELIDGRGELRASEVLFG